MCDNHASSDNHTNALLLTAVFAHLEHDIHEFQARLAIPEFEVGNENVGQNFTSILDIEEDLHFHRVLSISPLCVL
jgi:hypothetical protein